MQGQAAGGAGGLGRRFWVSPAAAAVEATVEAVAAVEATVEAVVEAVAVAVPPPVPPPVAASAIQPPWLPLRPFLRAATPAPTRQAPTSPPLPRLRLTEAVFSSWSAPFDQCIAKGHLPTFLNGVFIGSLLGRSQCRFAQKSSATPLTGVGSPFLIRFESSCSTLRLSRDTWRAGPPLRLRTTPWPARRYDSSKQSF